MKATFPVLLALAFSVRAQDTTLPADVGTATALATGAPVLGSSDSRIGTTVPGVSDGGGTTLSFEAPVHKRYPVAIAHNLQQPVRVRDVDDGAISVKHIHVGVEKLRNVDGNSEQWSWGIEGGGTGSWCCGGSGGMDVVSRDDSNDEPAIMIKKTYYSTHTLLIALFSSSVKAFVLPS
ncbi:hypothetical protein DFS33DRAFT_1490428 [Desarmillaria ectypa]|nr:hypothetical protein DFS33DRAFT_1490428 [Desarmillaria ectypa]